LKIKRLKLPPHRNLVVSIQESAGSRKHTPEVVYSVMISSSLEINLDFPSYYIIAQTATRNFESVNIISFKCKNSSQKAV
jgi:hypothetical protein